MTYNKLSGEVKVFIVQRLACFSAPSEVARAVEEQFGVSISPQGVEAYNPYRRSGERLSEKWRQLFEQTRKAYLEETSGIGISHRAVRLSKLDQQCALAEERGDVLTLLKLLKQAKKEMDGTHAKYRLRSGPDRRPSAPPVYDADVARKVIQILGEGLEKVRRGG